MQTSINDTFKRPIPGVGVHTNNASSANKGARQTSVVPRDHTCVLCTSLPRNKQTLLHIEGNNLVQITIQAIMDNGQLHVLYFHNQDSSKTLTNSSSFQPLHKNN